MRGLYSNLMGTRLTFEGCHLPNQTKHLAMKSRGVQVFLFRELLRVGNADYSANRTSPALRRGTVRRDTLTTAPRAPEPWAWSFYFHQAHSLLPMKARI